jgi:hypothetical protein
MAWKDLRKAPINYINSDGRNLTFDEQQPWKRWFQSSIDENRNAFMLQSMDEVKITVQLCLISANDPTVLCSSKLMTVTIPTGSCSQSASTDPHMHLYWWLESSFCKKKQCSKPKVEERFLRIWENFLIFCFGIWKKWLVFNFC